MARRSYTLAGTAAFVGAASTASADARLDRSRYLVEAVAGCGNCHTPPRPNARLPGRGLAGGLRLYDAGHTAVSTNIMPDPETGIDKWTARRSRRRPPASSGCDPVEQLPPQILLSSLGRRLHA
jgi:hypothetical protein